MQAVLAGPAVAQSADAEQVLEQFERAMNAHDEEGVVGLFAADAAVRDNVGGEVLRTEHLREWTRRAAERNLHIHFGDYATSDGRTQFAIEAGQGEWYRESEPPMRARGTAEVRRGKIVQLVLEPVSAPGERAVVAGRPVAVLSALPLMLVGLVAGMAWYRLRGRTAVNDPRPAGGALMTALSTWSAHRRHSFTPR